MLELFEANEPFFYNTTNEAGERVQKEAGKVIVKREKSIGNLHRAAWYCKGVSCFLQFCCIAEIETLFGRELHLNTGGHGSSVGK